MACHRAAKLAQLLGGGRSGGANCAYILRPKVIVEIWPRYTDLRDRVLGEVERNSFMALSGKGGHSGLMPLRLCSTPGWVVKSLPVLKA